MDKNVEKMDAVVNGNYQCEFPDNQEAIAELEHLIAIKKLNIKIDETRLILRQLNRQKYDLLRKL